MQRKEAYGHKLRGKVAGIYEWPGGVAGMSVAPVLITSPIRDSGRRLAHAVDNPGDFTGALASRLAFERWWQPDPLASGSSRDRVGD
jgi:hypothetical protein